MEKKPTVLGKFVYVDVPLRDELKIQVDQNTKENLEKEFLSKLKRLKIWAIGDGANPKLRAGQEVLVNPEALARGAKMVEFEDGITRALVLDYDIVHIW